MSLRLCLVLIALVATNPVNGRAFRWKRADVQHNVEHPSEYETDEKTLKNDFEHHWSLPDNAWHWEEDEGPRQDESENGQDDWIPAWDDNFSFDEQSKKHEEWLRSTDDYPWTRVDQRKPRSYDLYEEERSREPLPTYQAAEEPVQFELDWRTWYPDDEEKPSQRVQKREKNMVSHAKSRGLALSALQRKLAPLALEKTAPLVVKEQVVPFVVEEKVAPLVVQEQAAPLAVQEKAAPLAAQEKAALLVAQGKVAPLVLEEKAAPLAVREQATPLIAQDKVAPFVVQEQAAPSIVQEKTAPLILEKKVAPLVVQEHAAPLVVQEKVAPLVLEEKAARLAIDMEPAEVISIAVKDTIALKERDSKATERTEKIAEEFNASATAPEAEQQSANPSVKQQVIETPEKQVENGISSVTSEDRSHAKRELLGPIKHYPGPDRAPQWHLLEPVNKDFSGQDVRTSGSLQEEGESRPQWYIRKTETPIAQVLSSAPRSGAELPAIIASARSPALLGGIHQSEEALAHLAALEAARAASEQSDGASEARKPTPLPGESSAQRTLELKIEKPANQDGPALAPLWQLSEQRWIDFADRLMQTKLGEKKSP